MGGQPPELGTKAAALGTACRQDVSWFLRGYLGVCWGFVAVASVRKPRWRRRSGVDDARRRREQGHVVGLGRKVSMAIVSGTGAFYGGRSPGRADRARAMGRPAGCRTRMHDSPSFAVFCIRMVHHDGHRREVRRDLTGRGELHSNPVRFEKIPHQAMLRHVGTVRIPPTIP